MVSDTWHDRTRRLLASRRGTGARILRTGLVAALLASCAPHALHAEISIADLERKFAAAEAAHAREIAELKAQLRSMKDSVSETRTETHRVAVGTRAIAARQAAYTLPPPSPALPTGVTPVFVTASKQFKFGSVTVTPGGFFAAESVFRNHANGSELATAFGSAPFPNSPAYHTNEFRPTARQTRVALLAEGQVTPTLLLSGYGEVDFLGAAQTANSNQTNSYNLRIRNLYGTIDAYDYGFHFLAGQNWTLATLNSKGITPRNEVLPPTIDPSQMPGSVYARQAQVRIVKDFDKKLWLALSAEESETIINPACATPGIAPSLTPATPGLGVPGINSITCGTVGNGGAFSNLTNYSLNHVPDVIAKAAYEARIADRDVHLETYGMYRNLYDRVSYTNGTATNMNTAGYGVGVGLIVPVVPKTLDFQISGLIGRGVTRYGTGQLTDATFNTNGSLRPVSGALALTGLTWHATPSLDIYGFAGIDKISRTYTRASNGTLIGLGQPGGQVDTGCPFENSAAATCAGASKRVYELMAGVWDKIYKGDYGELRVGLQYAYVNREIFNNPGLYAPKTDFHTVYTSLRYYPFQ